ncbi:MAG: MEKHLA domain-containing protein [bacterium]|nr:MEKHLA domain-containing protein [bacterium]
MSRAKKAGTESTRRGVEGDLSFAHARALLAAIVDSSDDAIIGKTLDGIVTSWNAAAMRMFGYTAEEMIGTPITRLLPPERSDDMRRILDQIRQGNRVDHFETERVRKDGTRLHVSLTVSPIRDADDRVVGASKIARDVSERRRAEEAKDRFLALLGHELRNPLAAVQSAIITAYLDPERREQALDIARRQTAQLRQLVDDLLDVARVQHGKITLRKVRIPLREVVRRAVEAVAQIPEQGHTLSQAVAEEIIVDADPGRLEQVVANLLSNAAKYTPPGGHIDVRAEVDGSEVVLAVSDTGVGIEPAMLAHVFETFAQADRSLDRAQGGLGLGLALVRTLVELHGGRVEARSHGLGRGAEFLVRLPLPPPATESRADPAPPTAPPLSAARSTRVVVVEDNTDAAYALSMLVEVLGHQVEVAHDGLGALVARERARPEVMLVDIGLPGIDGLEVARRIRAQPGGAETLLVALTGYGRDEDKERSRLAGFDLHLTKPVGVEDLTDVLGDPARFRRRAQ